ncbi:MAG TPA: GNAT family N-acetyltransferase [Pyrinomonadaceae bacterium]|nr:GNAT family N-acetyltransferase [Pyrinomonadaceae bacterium]
MQERSLKKKAPEDCSAEEIAEFMTMVLEGGQVQEQRLRELVMSADSLGFARINEALVSVAAVKMPRTRYREKVFQRARSSENAAEFELEFGWAFTRPEHEGQGLGSGLADLLFQRISQPVFATTSADNEAMRHILEKRGFCKSGSPYQGRQEKKVLYVRIGT